MIAGRVPKHLPGSDFSLGMTIVFNIV